MGSCGVKHCYGNVLSVLVMQIAKVICISENMSSKLKINGPGGMQEHSEVKY